MKRITKVKNTSASRMKLKTTIFIFTIFMISSCTLFKSILTKSEKVNRLIDQKDEYIWENNNYSKSYLLQIDNNEGIWFEGKIIINNLDTLYIKGFEKGNIYPTYYKCALSDTAAIGPLLIHTRGLNADTVEIENKSGNFSKITEKVSLIKKKKS